MSPLMRRAAALVFSGVIVAASFAVIVTAYRIGAYLVRTFGFAPFFVGFCFCVGVLYVYDKYFDAWVNGEEDVMCRKGNKPLSTKEFH